MGRSADDWRYLLGRVATINMFDSFPGLFLILLVIWPAPLWIPVAFLAYALGRRRFNLWTLTVFITVECLALGALVWSFGQVLKGGFSPS